MGKGGPLGRRVVSIVAMAIPILFFILPQASCTGQSFTGFSLFQILSSGFSQGTDDGLSAMGGFAVFAILSMVGAVTAAGVLGFGTFFKESPPALFRGVGIFGVIASFLGMIAIQNREWEWFNVRLEAGFWIVTLGFLFLIFSPAIAELRQRVPWTEPLDIGIEQAKKLFGGGAREKPAAEPDSGLPGQAREVSPPSAPSAPSLDEGQIAARNAWQAATGSNYIYCRKCGKKLAIWNPDNFCGNCGYPVGLPNGEVSCISDLCGARVDKRDGYCFKCGSEQPSSDPL